MNSSQFNSWVNMKQIHLLNRLTTYIGRRDNRPVFTSINKKIHLVENLPNCGFPKMWNKLTKRLDLNNSTARIKIQVKYFLLAQHDDSVKCNNSSCRQCIT